MSATFKTLTIAVAMIASAPAIAIFAAPAASAEQRAYPQLTVEYGDLDLGTEAGARTLLKRLEHGAKRVCGVKPITDRWGTLTIYNACRAKAVADAVRDVGAPAVTLAWQGAAEPVAIASR